MSSQDESRLYDVRTLERNVRKGLINKKDLEKHLKGLPDVTDKATACNPESQAREAPPPVSHRPIVVATPAALDDDGDLLDEDGALLDDESDDDEDEDLDDDEADEA